MRRALWIVLAVLVWPASAHAGSLAVPAPDSAMETAHALAVARWKLEPCNGNVAVSWAHMGEGVNAHSDWIGVQGEPATYVACRITYNLDAVWTWPKLCTVIEHELGHLAGNEHSDDPRDVMAIFYGVPAPECGPEPAAPELVAIGPPIKGAGPAIVRSIRRPSHARMRRIMALCRISRAG